MAVEFIDSRRVVLLMGRGGVASLPFAVCGRRFSKSWMCQPECDLIYDLLTSLENSVPCARFIDGKWTAVEPRLAATIDRIALDEGRQRRILANAPSPAKQLYDKLRKQGGLRLSPPQSAEFRVARQWLEKRLLVTSSSYHGPDGRHGVLMGRWHRIASKSPFEGSLEKAVDVLLLASIHSAVFVDKIKAIGWLPDFAERFAALQASDEIVEIPYDNKRQMVAVRYWANRINN